MAKMSTFPDFLYFNESQFSELVTHLGQTDWWSISVQIIFQLLAVGIAAYSGFFYQKKFRKIENRENEIKKVYSFNESVLYLAALLEAISLHIDQLVLPAFIHERDSVMKTHALVRSEQEQVFKMSFTSIRPIEKAEESHFLAKITDVGRHIDVAHVFFRMRNEILQFAFLCEERNSLIKKFIYEGNDEEKRWKIELRCNEVYDRTSKLLMSGEAIFDSALYLMQKLNFCANEIESDLKRQNIEQVKVFNSQKNEAYEKLRKTLLDIIDTQFPDARSRLLLLREDSP